jgi:hypothetical protein
MIFAIIQAVIEVFFIIYIFDSFKTIMKEEKLMREKFYSKLNALKCFFKYNKQDEKVYTYIEK